MVSRFPERRAYTVKYELSDAEASLYASVTDYVREEMNRVDRFADIDNKKRVNVGFVCRFCNVVWRLHLLLFIIP